MKTRAIVSLVFLAMLAAMSILGCTIRTTLTVEEYDVRLVNRSGSVVKVRWGNGSYYHIDNGGVIYIPAEEGHYELEWVDIPSSRHVRPKKIFQISVEADIDIEFYDEPDIIIIER